jgi:hypothetical protein
MKILLLIYGKLLKKFYERGDYNMSLQLLIFYIFFIPLLILFIFINVRHNYINKNKKAEIIASPIYYILICISMIWFSYVLIIGLDPHF